MERCTYCNSELKISELSCPQCNEKIFIKETCIEDLPWIIILWRLIKASIVLIILMGLLWLFNLLFFVVVIFFILIIIGSILTLIFKKKDLSGQFIISNKNIQFKMRDEKAIEFVWNEINKIEIIKERYKTNLSSETGSITVTGYNLKFYLLEGERSVRLWCKYITQDKPKEKVIDLIKEFSKYLKKEIIESEDLAEIKYRRFYCFKDEAYWNRKTNPIVMQLINDIINLSEELYPDLKKIYYNNQIVLLGTTKRNCIWIFPRKNKYINIEISNESLMDLRINLNEIGIRPRESNRRSGNIYLRFPITENTIERYRENLKGILKKVLDR